MGAAPARRPRLSSVADLFSFGLVSICPEIASFLCQAQSEPLYLLTLSEESQNISFFFLERNLSQSPG
jgi:hypothetical protein